MVKNRAYNRDKIYSDEESKSAIFTLYTILDALLRYFAPIIPFLTDYIYRAIYDKSVHTMLFPDLTQFQSQKNLVTDKLVAFNKSIWTLKQENGLSLKDKITAIQLPEVLLPFQKDFKIMHSIGKFEIPQDTESKKILISEKTEISVII